MAANSLVPFGFRVANQYGGSPSNFPLNVREIAYNYGTQIAFGDPVKSLSTGYVNVFANGNTTVHGVLAGVEYVNPTAIGGFTFAPYWLAPAGLASTTHVIAKVYNDPTTVFMAQVNGAAITTASIGYNIDITAASSGAPNAAGISTCSLLSSSAATTATLPFRILGIVGISDGGVVNMGPIPGYDPTGANNFVYVKMNTSDLLNTTGI